MQNLTNASNKNFEENKLQHKKASNDNLISKK
jgi:hypothetical protein